jgi:thiamine kinase-like enzyme
VRPEAAVERVWPNAGAVLEPLGGGITNHNFLVVVGGEAFVLRVAGKDTELLGIDRRAELAASRAAEACGVGPEVVRFVEPEGWLVTRFIPGTPVGVEDVPVAEVAESIRLFHDGPAIPSRFDAFRVVEAYADTARAGGVEPPPAFGEAKAIAGAIERARGEQPLRPCHNDLLNANLIDDGERIRIVDWEYAGMGDVFFDLANFSINHGLDEARNEELLRAYFGEVRAEDLHALALMRFMSDFREAMWGVVQLAVSELDVDFEAYAREHFERLEHTAASRELKEALSAAAR